MPCSYCVRTKKHCSLNANWGKSRASPKEASVRAVSVNDETFFNDTKRRKTSSDASFSGTLELSQEDLSQALGDLEGDAPLYHGPDTHSFPDGQQSDINSVLPDFGDAFSQGAESTHAGLHDVGPPQSWDDFLGQLPPLHAVDAISMTDQSISQPSQFDLHPSIWDPQDSLQELGQTPLSMISSNFSRKRSASHASQDTYLEPLSLFSPEYMVSSSINNHLIIGNLLGIYNDVLENNLACWLAEENCPYKMRQMRDALSSIDGQQSDIYGSSQAGQRPPEWSQGWSNRMYGRVMQLDRNAADAKAVTLSRSDNMAASRALHLVIAAFSTQWAQGRRRHDLSKSAAGQSGHVSDVDTEFEKHLQQSVWRQAKKALQDVSDVESYRVVYAELVFGLTEKPWDEDDEASAVSALGGSPDQPSEVAHDKVMEVLSSDGPPVVLERAARKMQVLKFRLEAEDCSVPGYKKSAKGDMRSLGDEDRKTAGLLYWLAVMFDTVSSPMNERPVALDDEECQHDSLKQGDAGAAKKPSNSRSYLRWDLQLFTKEDRDKAIGSLRWPCTYDMAARAIARSAPIKILIFRHVSYLQNLLRRQDLGRSIEDAIWEATLVYRYWNTMYAPLYRDFVQNYDAVYTRLRAWFVCIYIPWHLASLMLADIIEHVDENKLGVDENSETRARMNMVSRIRTQSTDELAELARVIAPGDGAEQLPDYHHAVNEGPLLTEPWTVLLVRAFTKAALYHLDKVREARAEVWTVPGQENAGAQGSMRKTEHCARALASLGKKSAMSRHISRILYRELGVTSC